MGSLGLFPCASTSRPTTPASSSPHSCSTIWRAQGTRSSTTAPSSTTRWTTTPRSASAPRQAVVRDQEAGIETLGVVFGGSGNGEQIAANKVRGVRAALVWNIATAEARPRAQRRQRDRHRRPSAHRSRRRARYVDRFIAEPFSDEERASAASRSSRRTRPTGAARPAGARGADRTSSPTSRARSIRKRADARGTLRPPHRAPVRRATSSADRRRRPAPGPVRRGRRRASTGASRRRCAPSASRCSSSSTTTVAARAPRHVRRVGLRRRHPRGPDHRVGERAHGADQPARHRCSTRRSSTTAGGELARPRSAHRAAPRARAHVGVRRTGTGRCGRRVAARPVGAGAGAPAHRRSLRRPARARRRARSSDPRRGRRATIAEARPRPARR